MAMSANAEARQGAVDAVLTELGTVPAGLSDELFGVADVLAGSAQLRRAVTEPAFPVEDRRAVAGKLFGGRVSAVAVSVLDAAVSQNWRSGLAFVSAIERQGVRAVLLIAEQAGTLDEVEHTLFRFGRIVDATISCGRRWRTATYLSGARWLVATLLKGKVPRRRWPWPSGPWPSGDHTFRHHPGGYLLISAALRRRSLATVVVAHPLTADQEARLEAALTAQMKRPVNLMVVIDPTSSAG